MPLIFMGKTEERLGLVSNVGVQIFKKLPGSLILLHLLKKALTIKPNQIGTISPVRN